MAVLASTIIDNARILLQDQNTIKRWSDAELLVWLNLGQDQIVTYRPDANILITPFKLATNSTRQSLPDGTTDFQNPAAATLPYGLKLVDVIRNLGATGLLSGRTISVIDRTLLDQVDNSWHRQRQRQEVIHYTYSDASPRTFFITPAVFTGLSAWVEIAYTARPARVTAVGDSIGLPDEYESVLLDYVLFRACSISTDSQVMFNKALAYYEAFLRALRAFDSTKYLNSPNTKTFEPSPSIRPGGQG